MRAGTHQDFFHEADEQVVQAFLLQVVLEVLGDGRGIRVRRRRRKVVAVGHGGGAQAEVAKSKREDLCFSDFYMRTRLAPSPSGPRRDLDLTSA